MVLGVEQEHGWGAMREGQQLFLPTCCVGVVYLYFICVGVVYCGWGKLFEACVQDPSISGHQPQVEQRRWEAVEEWHGKDYEHAEERLCCNKVKLSSCKRSMIHAKFMRNSRR